MPSTDSASETLEDTNPAMRVHALMTYSTTIARFRPMCVRAVERIGLSSSDDSRSTIPGIAARRAPMMPPTSAYSALVAQGCGFAERSATRSQTREKTHSPMGRVTSMGWIG